MEPQHDDRVLAHRSSVVRAAALAILLGCGVNTAISVLDASSAPFNFGLALGGAALSVGALQLLRWRRSMPAAVLLLAGLFLIGLLGAYYGGGSRSSVYDVFFVVILFGGFLFGARTAVALGLAAIASFAVIAWIESVGALPPARFPLTPSIRWTSLCTGMIAASGLVWIGLRMTERVLEDVKRSEDRYRLVTDNASDFVWALDANWVYTFASPSVESILGYRPQEMIGKRWQMGMLVPGSPNVESLLQAAVAERQDFVRYEAEHLRRNGKTVWCEVDNRLLYDASGTLLGATGNTRDISKRKEAETREREMERQLRESQRLEAVGKLAGGIAHDFNNYLTVILGNAEMLVRELEGEQAEYLADLRTAASHSADLTRQLLAFSRRQIMQPVVIDLNETIRDADRLLQRVLGEDVALETRYAEDLGPTRADPSQVHQIILNLAVNARAAMPDGGHLVIETANVDVAPSDEATRTDLDPGRYVVLSVGDDGVGIDPETLPHVFEPFFTTRHEGSGLGLSTVHGIVKQSGGSILVESEVGCGTVFRIYLPRTDGDVAPAVVDSASAVLDDARGFGRVLLVEDLELLRDWMARTLEEYGYSVSAAETAESAIDILRDEDEPFDLLVTDIVLPGMNGVELSDWVLERFGMPVIFVTGFAESDIALRGQGESGATLLLKPFSGAELRARVGEVFDASSVNP